MQNTPIDQLSLEKHMQIFQQLSEFALNHWILSSLLLLILILIFAEQLRNREGGSKLSPQNAVHLINRSRATVVDLRDKDLFDAGRIAGAIHLAHSTMMGNLVKINKYKDKPLILVDTTGNQSATAFVKLNKEGFKQVFVLSGGINAWKDAGLPLVK